MVAPRYVRLAALVLAALGLLACKRSSSSDAPGTCVFSNPSGCSAQCEKGNAESCNVLGEAQEKGAGVAKSFALAATSYERACTLGSMPGCNNLGTLYLAGQGVPRDNAKALGLFRKACDGGRPSACYNAGVVLEHKLAPSNPTAAAPLYEKACNGDYANACTNLGTLYYTGRGVPKDLERARSLYRKGCKAGDKDACEAAKH